MCESRFTVLRLVFAVAVAVCISNCQAVAQEAPASPDPPVEPAISPEDAQRIQAKANAVLAEVQAQAAAGNVRQEVIAKMEKLGPLTDSGKLVEAEALLDEVLKDLGITVKLPQSEPEPQQKPSGDAKDGTPMSEVPPQKELSSTQLRLMKKGQLAVAEFKRRAESGDVLRNVADRLEQFGGLMEASKFKQAEALIDEALQALGIDPQTLKKKARKRSAFDKQKPALGHSGPVSSGPLPKFDSTEFTKIFDGESLDGWNGDPTYWSVENGKLAGTVTPDTLLEKNSWILWQGGSVEDFELVLDYRVSVQGNSGIGYRLAVLEGEPYSVRGPQADIDGRGMFSGICYEENGRRLLAGRGQTTWIGDSATLPRLIAQLGDPAQLRAILRTEDWNRYRLVVKGNVAKHFINGALICIDGGKRDFHWG